MMSNTLAQISDLQAEVARWREAEHGTSQAYLRLRSLIPNAYQTPYASTPEQVWMHTEACLREWLTERDEIIAGLREENAALHRQYNDQLTRVSRADAETTRIRYESDATIAALRAALEAIAAVLLARG
jgi:hypothetical protein